MIAGRHRTQNGINDNALAKEYGMPHRSLQHSRCMGLQHVGMAQLMNEEVLLFGMCVLFALGRVRVDHHNPVDVVRMGEQRNTRLIR